MDTPSPNVPAPLGQRLGAGLGYAIEGLMYVLALGTPWAFGGVDYFELFIFLGVGLMLVLWALRVLVEWRFAWKRCPIALGLAALFLWGVWQLAPLPPGLMAVLSPAGKSLADGLLAKA